MSAMLGAGVRKDPTASIPGLALCFFGLPREPAMSVSHAPRWDDTISEEWTLLRESRMTIPSGSCGGELVL